MRRDRILRLMSHGIAAALVPGALVLYGGAWLWWVARGKPLSIDLAEHGQKTSSAAYRSGIRGAEETLSRWRNDPAKSRFLDAIHAEAIEADRARERDLAGRMYRDGRKLVRE